jgi:hypothetical protein
LKYVLIGYGYGWVTLEELQNAWMNIAQTISDNLSSSTEDEDLNVAYNRAMKILG